MPTRPIPRSLLLRLGLGAIAFSCAAAACAAPAEAPADAGAGAARDAAPPGEAEGVAAAAAAGIDPLRLRHDLLARLDADVDAAAAAGHLRARVLLDEVLPVPYVGFDADPWEDGARAGMRVTKVYPGTGAEKAGLRAGDVVLAVDGEPTPAGPRLGAAIRRHRVGDTFALRLLRDGAETDLATPLGRRPEEDEDEEEQFPELRGPDGAPPPAATFDFEGPRGALPEAFEAVLGGHGRPPKWSVTSSANSGAHWLVQDDADATGIRFPMAILRGPGLADGSVTVRFRLDGGRQHRAAGVVLRFRDAANYLVARVNATENDLRIFRVVNGLRRTLPGGRVEAKGLDDGRWHTLTFAADCARLTASVDGGPEASSFDTYLLRGRAGLWTKSDAVTAFDDFAVAPLR